jgi:hypothetical protein
VLVIRGKKRKKKKGNKEMNKGKEHK